MTLNPLLPLNYALLLGTALLLLGAFSAWRSADRARPATRMLVTGLRLLGIAGLILLLCNPGSWHRPRGSHAPRWTILLDRSLSMDTEDVAERSRWQAAVALTKKTMRQSGGPEAVDCATFGEQLTTVPLAELPDTTPTADASDATGALRELLARHAAAPEGLAGILLLSDGAQLPISDPKPVARQARALGVPIWAVPLGGEVVPPNLRLTPKRRHLTGFAGQEVACIIEASSQNLPPTAPNVQLADAASGLLAEERVELPADSQRLVRFMVRLPDQPGLRQWRVSAPMQDGERLGIDNHTEIGVSILAGKVRVLLLEGTPGWDSKFLARVLRKQPHMEVSELYRLGATRQQWLSPSGETADVTASKGPLAAGFDRFDVVICGRAVDEILDAGQALALRHFVTKRGGCVLFARGRPARHPTADLEALFPLSWREPQEGSFRWQPVAAGQRLGLFGERLPACEAKVWQQLPTLDSVFACAERTPPATTVLAQSLGSDGTEHPLLASRRVGLGLTVAFNGGDFWQWDFFPQTPRSKEVYQAFWPQLLQWMLSYAEFLPGQPLALRLSRDLVRPGETVGIHVLARSGVDRKQIRLRSRAPGEDQPTEIPAQPSTALNGTPRAAHAFHKPGQHQVEAYLADAPGEAGARAPVQVLSPPPETAHRSADPDFLHRLAEGSGGRLIEAKDLGELPRAAAVDQANAELTWVPAWDHLWALLLVALVFGTEWIIRRRSAVP